MVKKHLLLWGSFAASAALTLFFAPMAQAHVGLHGNGGFLHGLEHPWGGADHILAMVGVGLWAAQLGGVARWSLPLAFLGMMLVGGLLGMTGLSLPMVEPGILISDLLLGILVFTATRLPWVWSFGLVGVMAVFHGYVHGAEMPMGAPGWEYAVGFVCSTALLHLCGLGVGVIAHKRHNDRLLQVAGAGVLVGGLLVTFRSLVGG